VLFSTSNEIGKQKPTRKNHGNTILVIFKFIRKPRSLLKKLLMLPLKNLTFFFLKKLKLTLKIKELFYLTTYAVNLKSPDKPA
jgi:hypothetical protein